MKGKKTSHAAPEQYNFINLSPMAVNDIVRSGGRFCFYGVPYRLAHTGSVHYSETGLCFVQMPQLAQPHIESGFVVHGYDANVINGILAASAIIVLLSRNCSKIFGFFCQLMQRNSK